MYIIQAEELTKEFNGLVAVNKVSFTIDKAEIFGFLGPNGAGKTTTINMLCTLLKPTSGTAILNGYDVVRQPNDVRRSIGLVFQDPSLDDRLTAWENLQFHALVYGVPKEHRLQRMEEVLKMVELYDRRNDTVKTFSGGMKRRLEIARGLLHFPKVLFLDEPTLGLDPQTRSHIWNYIHELKDREGITIFLTTHYMDEAEHCGRIAIIDYGKIVALDTPDNLKKQVGGDIITVKTDNDEEAQEIVRGLYKIEVTRDENGIHFEIVGGEEFIPRFVKEFGRPIRSISLRRPTLEDVFLKLTGRAIREEEAGAVEQMRIHARAWRRGR
ncbi:MAG: ATP-binding cassette domain-containing protein [Actinomycetota bacterium]